MKKYGFHSFVMCACYITILAEDTLQRQIQGKLDKEYNSQKEKKVIRVDKVLQNHVLQDVWIQDREKESVRKEFRRDDKPIIKWFDKNMNLHFPTSNHLHHPFHIRRAPIPTAGMPWPKPQNFKSNDKTLYRIKRFSVRTNLTKCELLTKAVKRYKDIIFTCHNSDFINNLLNVKDANFMFSMPRLSPEYLQSQKELSRLYLEVASCSHYPSLSSDESYTIKMSSRGILVRAQEVWGAMRALETLSQLVICINNTFVVRKTEVIDFPRFPHRGILIDSARHFMSKETMFQMLRAMEMNKMNVLHWHLSDDQSFPYKSVTFPNLSEKGAYHPFLTYSVEDVKDIIEFARVRGIRIIPEFDTPGHTYAWGLGHPELLTQCYDNRGPIPGHFGPMNPARNQTYTFLSLFFKEILELFKDQFIHLGNDEVPLACWKTNPEVIKFMSQINRISSFKNEGTAAWSFFTERLIQSIKNVTSSRENVRPKFILWQEAFQSNLNIPSDAIVQIWMGSKTLVEDVTRRGYYAIVSTCWYINMIKYGVVWPEYYLCDPVSTSFGGRKELVLGGEACLWSEYITSETAVRILWPKASAVGERLWSDQSLRDINEAAPRLEEHRCRMLRRGLPVGDISGPGFCFIEPNENPINPDDISKARRYQSSIIKNTQGTYSFSAGILIVGMCVFAYFVFTIKRKRRSGCFITRLTRR